MLGLKKPLGYVITNTKKCQPLFFKKIMLFIKRGKNI